jgi:hyperosmotically inducible protein
MSGLMMGAALLFATAAPAKALTRGQDPQPQSTPKVTASDDQLEDAIEKAWKADPKLNGLKLDVAVDHGVATISGDVRNATQKTQAEKAARVDGVTSVKSELKINTDTRSTVDKAGDKTKAGLETAANKGAEGAATAAAKTEEAAGVAKDKTQEAAGKTADVASDTWLTTKVKSKIITEKSLKGSDITVSTTNGIVTLTGTVGTEAMHTKAVAVAKGTKGVKSVVDNLKVSTGTQE